MNIRFEPETFTKLLAKSKEEGISIASLVSKITSEHFKILHEEENNEYKETTGKASTLR